MSRYRSDPETLDAGPSTCTSFLRYTWKTITCLFSHVTLVSMVVSYCILGAFTFAKLEVDHEKEVKKNISTIRGNVTDELWKLATIKTEVLEEGNFTKEVIIRLQDFERSLLKAMTKDGWNGEEDMENVQWTITGALFYSIIVITTIGSNAVENMIDKSSIAKHSYIYKHLIDFETIREAVEIHKDSNNSNKDNGSYNLSNIWKTIL